MSKSSKFAILTLTVRQCSMLESVITASLAFMTRQLAAAKDPGEIAFYRTTPQKFIPLQALFANAEKNAARLNKPAKINLKTDDFLTVLGSLSKHNLEEALLAHSMADGDEKAKRRAALEEWVQLEDTVELADPRLHDKSQDAEEEEEDEET